MIPFGVLLCCLPRHVTLPSAFNVAERHAGHHGAVRRRHGVSSHPRAGRSGNWRSDGQGKAALHQSPQPPETDRCKPNTAICCSPGERSRRRRAAAQDWQVVYLHVLHGASTQQRQGPRCPSGQCSWCVMWTGHFALDLLYSAPSKKTSKKKHFLLLFSTVLQSPGGTNKTKIS